MNWNRVTLAIIGCLAVWRGLWLAAGVPDTTALADAARVPIEKQCQPLRDTQRTPQLEPWRVSFASIESEASRLRSPIEIIPTAVDAWDPSLPIWITPGRDRMPGWAGWDDNGDGVIDDSGELGAAWSDDYCVVEVPDEPQPNGRVIDHGAFRPLRSPGDISDLRYHFNVVYIREAP